MKVITDFSVSSRPLRVGAGFTPRALFRNGHTGVWIDAARRTGIFSNVDGTLPFTAPGDAVARADDQSGNDHHALQSSLALRPLFGRAPVGVPSGGALDQGAGPHFIRFDLADDALSVALPAGSYDVMIFGRAGSWIERGVAIGSGGSLDVGPRTISGAPSGVMTALGDIVGWVVVDRISTEPEITRLLGYHKARGAKGLLVPGPELLTNPDFADGTSGWSVFNFQHPGSGTSTLSAENGIMTVANGAEGGVAVAYQIAATTPGAAYLVEVGRHDGTRSRLRIRDGTVNAGAYWIDQPASGFTVNTRDIGVALGSASSIGVAMHTTQPDNSFALSQVSLRELRPQEDW